jgi:lysophospholipase L1-like esterase
MKCRRTRILAFWLCSAAAFLCPHAESGKAFANPNSPDVSGADAAERPQYVAMGSSFAAGPGIATRVDPGPAACMRSSANYAQLLARKRALALIDVSCGGATTADVLRGGQFDLAAQLDAVTSNTKLVTVTIGGNDVFYIGTMGAMACQKQEGILAEQRLRYCTTRSWLEIDRAFIPLEQHLRDIGTAVRERAPGARVIFVGYLRVLPIRGTCARLALTSSEADRLRTIAQRLDEATARAAHAVGADFVSTARLSRGHDACSADPWTNGFSLPSAPGTFETAPFHPNAKGMASIAIELDRLLSSKRL